VLTGPVTSASRTLVASLGSGNDRFTASLLGGTQIAGNLNISVSGQRGNDRLSGFSFGTFAGQSSFYWSTQGGQGDDTLSFQQSSNINQSAVETVIQSGGNGEDKITASYIGRLLGSLTVIGDGGTGNDRISTILIVANTSTGVLVGSAVLGGPDNDNLTFLIPNQGSAFVFNQIIDGDGGIDSCTRTTNVLAFHCETNRFA
jgi:hypothetical protein